jgi:hypothetical protein
MKNIHMRTSRSLSGSGCGFFGGSCGTMAIFAAIIYIPIVIWTNRNLDFWVSHFKGETVDVPLWMSCVASIFESIVLLDLLGEIARLAI